MSLAFHTTAWTNSQHHAVLLAGEMQRAGLGQHAARVGVSGWWEGRVWMRCYGGMRKVNLREEIVFLLSFSG